MNSDAATAVDTDFTRSITSARLPQYRLNNQNASLECERPLLDDVLYDTESARKDRESAASATTTTTSGTQLAAWRLQVRAIFFPRAHIIAQQQAKRGETVAVLDQSTEWFEMLSLFLTVANIVVVAIDDPTEPETAPSKLALDKFDTFFSLFYFFEMVIRIISFGVTEFWADAFNRLDAVVVAFGLTSLALKLTSSSLANITFVRALRVLRPLRTMTQFRQTRLTVASVIGSFRELLDVWLLFMVFFGVLCVIAIDPFRGVLRNRCLVNVYFSSFENLPPLNENTTVNDTAYVRAVDSLKAALVDARDPNGLGWQYHTDQQWREFIYNTSVEYPSREDYVCQGKVDQLLGLAQTHSASCVDRRCSVREGTGRECPTGYTCDKVENPNFGFLGFDNLFLSALTTFVLLTTSFWVDIYTMMYDASTGLAGLYSVFAVIVGRYFVVSIIIAIVTDRFREKHRQQLLVMQQLDEAAARASKRIRVKSLIETSLEALEVYFQRLRNLEEIEIHHDFASALEEDVLVRRTKREWDNFRFVDEDLYDTQASMIRRSASMGTLTMQAAKNNRNGGSDAVSSSGGGGGGNNTPSGTTSTSAAANAVSKMIRSTAGKDDSGFGPSSSHYILDDAAKRRRWFAREIVMKRWFLITRIIVSFITLAYLATEYEGIEGSTLHRVRFFVSLVIFGWWAIELTLRALSRRFLLLVTDYYYVVEVVCIVLLGLSLIGNFGKAFGSLAESFFLGRFTVFLSESHRITPLYRWIRIIVAAFRSSFVLIAIILLALFLLACTGMQVFGAHFCSLEKPMSQEESIQAIHAGTCQRPRSNFDSFGSAMVSAFQMLTGDKWELILFAGMKSIVNRNDGHPAGAAILTGIIAANFVAAFIVLNYLFANLFISILLNSRAVNEEELRREAIRIQREVHYEKLLARRQLQLEAGLYDVAAVASALFNFNQFFRKAGGASAKKVFDIIFSAKIAAFLHKLRSYHVFATMHFVCVCACTVGLILAIPIHAPDTRMHYFGLILIHLSTVGFTLRLVCELWVESYKMRLRKIQKRQRKNTDLFDFEDDVEELSSAAAAAAVAAGGGDDGHRGGKGGGGDDDKDDDAPLSERYAILSYFSRSQWHQFEGVLTCAGIVFGALRIFFSTFNVVVFVTSCLLCFRPLGFLEKAQGLQSVLRDIVHMLRNLACIMSLIVFFFIFYSLLGVQLLRGRMSVCTNSTIHMPLNCTQDGFHWGPVPLNFDDMGSAAYTLYSVATFSDWTDVFHQAQAAGHSPFNAFLVNIYFFFFVIAGGLFAQSLVTMMLIDTFEVRRLGGTERVSKQDQARVFTEERFSVQQKLVASIVPREVGEMRQKALAQRLGKDKLDEANNNKEQQQQEEKQQGIGQRGLRMTQSTWFRNMIVILVFLSFCVSASYRYPMSDFWTQCNYWADVVFTILFSIELILYLFLQALCVDLAKGTKWYKRLPLRIWNGWNVHFSSKWNWFDAIIVVLSVLGLTLERYADQWAWTKNFRALRALRLLRLVKNNPRIAGMVSRLGSALRQLFYVSIIFLICFMCCGSDAARQTEAPCADHATRCAAGRSLRHLAERILWRT